MNQRTVAAQHTVDIQHAHLDPSFVFDFQPKQHLLQQKISNVYLKGNDYVHKYVGFGGARGGSKSHGGRDVCLYEALRWEKLNVLIMRRKSKQIQKNHIAPFFKERPYFRRFFNETKIRLSLPNGSVIQYGIAEHEEDIYDWQGEEYDIIFVDEAQQFTQLMIEVLQGSLRTSSGSGYLYPKMLLGFNPGGIGHTYLKRTFVEREFNEYENPDDFYFIRAFVWDNYYHLIAWARRVGLSQDEFYSLSEEDRMKIILAHSNYAKNLLSKPEHLRKAWLYGDWDTFVGQFFQRYNADIHEVPRPPIEEDQEKARESWVIEAGLDYGGDTVLEVMATNSQGNSYFVGELAFHDRTLGPEYKANATKDFLDKRGWGNILVVGDTNIFNPPSADSIMGTKSVAEYYLNAGVNLVRVNKRSEGGKGYRILCNEAVTSGLFWERNDATGEIKTRPKIYFVPEECPELCSTLPMLMVDDERIEDIEDSDKDHAYDAAKMVYMFSDTPQRRTAQEIKEEDNRIDRTGGNYEAEEEYSPELDGTRF